MNIFSYSFYDLEGAKMVSGLTVAFSKEAVLDTIAYNGFKAINVSVKKLPELRPAIEVDGLGIYHINEERLHLLSHELLIRKGGGDI